MESLVNLRLNKINNKKKNKKDKIKAKEKEYKKDQKLIEEYFNNICNSIQNFDKKKDDIWTEILDNVKERIDKNPSRSYFTLIRIVKKKSDKFNYHVPTYSFEDSPITTLDENAIYMIPFIEKKILTKKIKNKNNPF